MFGDKIGLGLRNRIDFIRGRETLAAVVSTAGGGKGKGKEGGMGKDGDKGKGKDGDKGKGKDGDKGKGKDGDKGKGKDGGMGRGVRVGRRGVGGVRAVKVPEFHWSSINSGFGLLSVIGELLFRRWTREGRMSKFVCTVGGLRAEDRLLLAVGG